MTSLLEKAFKEAARLPDEQQDALAALLLEELASEVRWRKLLSESPGALATLAEEALGERRSGRTVDLDKSL